MYRAVHSGGHEGQLPFPHPPARKTKQGVYAIIYHNNLKQKASVWFVSLKVLEVFFCVVVKAKHPTRNPVCMRETPVKVCGVCPRRQKILGTALMYGNQTSNNVNKTPNLKSMRI